MPNAANQNSRKEPSPIRFYRVGNPQAGMLTASLATAFLFYYFQVLSLPALAALYLGLALAYALAFPIVGALIYVRAPEAFHRFAFFALFLSRLLTTILTGLFLYAAIDFTSLSTTFGIINFCLAQLFTVCTSFFLGYQFNKFIYGPHQPFIHEYINEGHLTSQVLQDLPFHQRQNLKSRRLRKLYLAGNLKFPNLLKLKPEQRLILVTDKKIRQRFVSGNLDLALVTDPYLQDYVNEGTLSLQEAKTLNGFERNNLAEPVLRELFCEGYINIQQLRNLDSRQSSALIFDEDARQQFKAGNSILAYVGSPLIATYVAEGYLTLQQAENLNWQEKQNLNTHRFHSLITANRITMQQLRNLHEHQRCILDIPMITQSLLRGELTIGRLFDTLGDNIINSQNTHTQSVHKSVSESALRLLKNYKTAANANLEPTIKAVQQWVNNLKEDSIQNRTAKTCIQRLTKTDDTFTDPTSDVSTRQLLALAWTAMHDDNMRIGKLEDAHKLFINGLYEIQRGYNLNAKGKDTNTKSNDSHICSAGTFNKIMEKLVGIHPDVIVIFISKETATIKLPIIVKEEAQRYLTTLIKAKGKNEPATVAKTLNNVKEEGTTAIWQHIELQVSNRLFDEFGSLFKDRSDTEFTNFVAAGKDTEINGIKLPKPYSLKDTPAKPLLYSATAKKHSEHATVTTDSRITVEAAADLTAQVKDNADLQTKTKVTLQQAKIR